MRGMGILVRFLMNLCVVCAMFLASIASSCRGYSVPERHVALFVFGDSLFDPGNNDYISPSFQANFWPYGKTFFGFPTGRATDGRIIPGFISEYAKLPLIPPYLQPGFRDYTCGVNFASIGAGALVETNQGFVIDLQTQLSNFKKVEKQLRHIGSEKAKALVSSAVYLISIGSNDYLAPLIANASLFRSKSRQSKEEYVGMVIGNLTKVIKEIHSKGGRKFGFLNVMGCNPGIKLLLGVERTEETCGEEASALARLHNGGLSQALRRLESELEGFAYSEHDFYASIIKRLKDPSKYGFKEAGLACCGSGPYRGNFSCGKKSSGLNEFELCENPREFLFFDSAHPTDKANEQIAKLFWSGSSNVTRPRNLKSLFEL